MGPLFSVVYFTRGTLPEKKGKRALLGDLAKPDATATRVICSVKVLGMINLTRFYLPGRKGSP